MQVGAPSLKLKAAEIMLAMVGHDPTPVRHHVMKKPHKLLACLIADLIGAPPPSLS